MEVKLCEIVKPILVKESVHFEGDHENMYIEGFVTNLKNFFFCLFTITR
jgi:hypothetical protein